MLRIGFSARSRLPHGLPATLLLVGALACERGDGQAPPGRSAREQLPTAVDVARATLDTIGRRIQATAAVEPIRTVEVYSQLSGTLTSVLVEEGDVVRAGTVLARLDARELQAQLRSAAANLEVARRAAERSEQLREQQIITVAEYEADQAEYAAARASHDQLQTRVAYATIRAPIAGVVLQKSVESGHVVGAQTRLFTVGDVAPLVVRVPVSELDVSALSEGDQVAVSFDALPGVETIGRIRRIFPAADTTTRLVPVEVALPAGDAAIRPGFLARVTFRLSPRSGVLTVPSSALLETTSGAAVFVVDDGRASRRRVQRGESYEGRVEITEGLSPGDTVVVAGNAELRDGADVRVSPVAGPASATTATDAGRPVEGGTAGDTLPIPTPEVR